MKKGTSKSNSPCCVLLRSIRKAPKCGPGNAAPSAVACHASSNYISEFESPARLEVSEAKLVTTVVVGRTSQQCLKEEKQIQQIHTEKEKETKQSSCNEV